MPSALITFASRWAFQIPAALYFSYSLGYRGDGYWIALFVTNLIFSVIGGVWFRLGRWKKAALS